jgi:hypothetical protein
VHDAYVMKKMLVLESWDFCVGDKWELDFKPFTFIFSC